MTPTPTPLQMTRFVDNNPDPPRKSDNELKAERRHWWAPRIALCNKIDRNVQTAFLYSRVRMEGGAQLHSSILAKRQTRGFSRNSPRKSWCQV